MSAKLKRWFERPPIGNVGRNLLPTLTAKWAGWTQFVGGGGSISISGEEVTISTNGALGFGFLLFDVTPYVAANATISFSVEVRNAAGAWVQENIGAYGVHTISAGATSQIFGAHQSGDRFGFRCNLSALTGFVIRVGIGSNGVAEGSAKTLVLRRPTLEIGLVDNGSAYLEGIRPQSHCVFPYLANPTLSNGNTTGKVTVNRSLAANVNSDHYGVIIGDSISDEHFSGSDWPFWLQLRHPSIALLSLAEPGKRLSAFASAMPGAITSPEETDNTSVKPTFAIVQGGINDILQDSTFAAPAGLSLMSSLDTVCQGLRSSGINKIVILNVMPAMFSASFSQTTGDQESILAYNNASAAYAAKYGYGYVDAYSALRSAVNPVTFDVLYNSGDNLHPSADGGALLANLVSEQLMYLLE